MKLTVNYLRNFSWSHLPPHHRQALCDGGGGGHFQMRLYKVNILALFGYLQTDNIVNSYLIILLAIYHHSLFH